MNEDENLSAPRSLRILMADDDNKIATIYRTSLAGYLSRQEDPEIADLESELFGEEKPVGTGATVVVCQQGEEAVDLANQAMRSGEPFDVVVLDLRMPPGISGVEAAKRIREVDNEIPIIFVSGYSDFTTPDLHELVPPPSLVYFVEKPVTLARLADKIRESAAV